ncbi:MAG: ADP-ribosylglycohydrolase family protein [Pseudomonadota bacterium]
MASDITDRAVGAFLGLALGDAWGQPLEFVHGPAVRTQPVSLAPGRFRWTDDTHMALYLAEALLAQPDGPLDSERFGREVGERFVAWLHDPLTPSTAPGNTCMRGARAFEQSGDWRTSGVPHSDGCGAVMRIVPVAIAVHGQDLLEAARVQAVLTHAHPNALEAAMAGTWLCRTALEEGSFDAGLVRAAIMALRGPWARGGSVAASLEGALAVAATSGDWLDEGAVPPGDGGWRAGSALGLAVAAALRWGGDFATAVDRAARIDGDSDSVACLCGMLLGAAGGSAVLPAAWLAVLPERARIEALARALDAARP